MLNQPQEHGEGQRQGDPQEDRGAEPHRLSPERGLVARRAPTRSAEGL